MNRASMDPFSRRSFLYGIGVAAGASLALPVLEACERQSETTPDSQQALLVVDRELPLSQDWDGAAATHSPTLAGHYTIHDWLVDFNTVPFDGFATVDFTNLSSLSEGATNIRGKMAQRWEIAPDDSSITFFLREGVMSRFGNELTAEDVRWSFERSFSREGIAAFVLGAAGIDNIDAVETVDDYTIRLNFSGPTPYFWYLIGTPNGGTIIDSTEAKKHTSGSEPYADTWVHEQGGSFGPYEEVSRKEGSEVVYEARSDYYLGPPALSRVVWRQVPDSSSRLGLLQRGAADAAFRMTPRDIDAASQAEGVTTFKAEGNIPLHLEPNFEVEPLNDIRVRQAIAYAIPYDDILETVLFGQGRRWRGVIADIFDGFSDEGWTYDTDFDRARSLLAEAGHGNGVDLPPLTYRTDDEIVEQSALLMRASLAEAGMRFDLDKIPGAVLDDRKINTKDIPWFMGNTEIPLTPDVGYAVELFFVTEGSSSSFAGFQNSIHYDNPDIDRLATEMRTEPNPEERRQLAAEAQGILARDLPHIPIAQQGDVLPVRDNISGYVWYPVTQYHFYQWEKSS